MRKTFTILFFLFSVTSFGQSLVNFSQLQRIGTSEYSIFYQKPSDSSLWSISNNFNLSATGGSAIIGLPNRVLSAAATPVPKFLGLWGGLHDAAGIDINHNVWHFGDSSGNVSGKANGFDPLYASEILTDSAGNSFTGIVCLSEFWINNTSIGWYAVKGTDSTLWMWGLDAGQGFRGDGTLRTSITKPVQVIIPGGRKVIQIVSGYEVIALCSDGTVWTWGGGGCNDFGNPLGNGCSGNSWRQPGKTIGITTAKWVAGGRQWNYAICANDTIMAWGAKIALGITSTDGNPYTVPTNITAALGLPRGVTKIVTSAHATHAILKDSTLFGWGDSPQGEVGDSTMLFRNRNPYPTGWGYDYTTDLFVITPTQLVKTRHDFVNLYSASPYTYYTYAECVNNQWYFTGRDKPVIAGNGVTNPDSISGLMPTNYDQGWNDSIPIPVNPFTLQKSICVPAAPCVVNNAYTGCAGYTPPSNLPPTTNAGSNQTITTSTTTLSGASTPQSGRHIASYVWTQTAGPNIAYFSTFNDSTALVSNLVTTGSNLYHFCLTATDQLNSSNTACMTVGVTVPDPAGILTTKQKYIIVHN